MRWLKSRIIRWLARDMRPYKKEKMEQRVEEFLWNAHPSSGFQDFIAYEDNVIVYDSASEKSSNQSGRDFIMGRRFEILRIKELARKMWDKHEKEKKQVIPKT